MGNWKRTDLQWGRLGKCRDLDGRKGRGRTGTDLLPRFDINFYIKCDFRENFEKLKLKMKGKFADLVKENMKIREEIESQVDL